MEISRLALEMAIDRPRHVASSSSTGCQFVAPMLTCIAAALLLVPAKPSKSAGQRGEKPCTVASIISSDVALSFFLFLLSFLPALQRPLARALALHSISSAKAAASRAVEMLLLLPPVGNLSVGHEHHFFSFFISTLRLAAWTPVEYWTFSTELS